VVAGLDPAIVIPGRRASAGPGIQMHAQFLGLDSGFASFRSRPGMTDSNSLFKQPNKTQLRRPASLRAGYAVALPPCLARAREMARWVAQPLFFDAAFPLENAGASRRAIADVFLTAPGRALRGHRA
jgi:hypothetical protein